MNTVGAPQRPRGKQKQEDWVRRVQSGTVAEPGQGRSKRLWSVLFVVIKLT